MSDKRPLRFHIAQSKEERRQLEVLQKIFNKNTLAQAVRATIDFVYKLKT